jgi:DNA processing protein
VTATPYGERTSMACDMCLRRPWLLATLAGHLNRTGRRSGELLELGDGELLAALAGRRRTQLEHQLETFDPAPARARADRAGVAVICRCHPRYPERLWDLPAPPAVLHVAGDLERFLSLVSDQPVAVVGTRRPSTYGVDVARSLGRGLAASGVTVVSGMAQGIDAAAQEGALSAHEGVAAHEGALSAHEGAAAHESALPATGQTIAVLAAGPDRAYPASCRGLHRRIVATGAAVSELPPGSGQWRWMFPARNRLIAALSAMTVVVEAGERSGALLTEARARWLGRSVGAVPGRVTSPQAVGPHRLLAQGAHLVCGAQDVLDAVYGPGGKGLRADPRVGLDPELRTWLDAIASGHDTPAALARIGLHPEQGLQVLTRLELAGYIRRQPGGRFAVLP